MIRLYRAVCTWIEASARQMDAPDEFYPEGAGEAKSEHAHSYRAGTAQRIWQAIAG